MQNPEIIELYVELLDEGTETWRPTSALSLGGGEFKILAPSDYDAEDEAWAFLPGETVRVEQAYFANGSSGLIAVHLNPEVIRIHVPLFGNLQPSIRPTNALALGNGLYKILATPQYNQSHERWQFPPDSIVRLKKITSPDGHFTFLIAIESSSSDT